MQGVGVQALGLMRKAAQSDAVIRGNHVSAVKSLSALHLGHQEAVSGMGLSCSGVSQGARVLSSDTLTRGPNQRQKQVIPQRRSVPVGLTCRRGASVQDRMMRTP